jgi:hypothetical protein
MVMIEAFGPTASPEFGLIEEFGINSGVFGTRVSDPLSLN